MTVLSPTCSMIKSEPRTAATDVEVYTLNMEFLNDANFFTKNLALPKSIFNNTDRLPASGSKTLLFKTSSVFGPRVKMLSSLSTTLMRPSPLVTRMSPW